MKTDPTSSHCGTCCDGKPEAETGAPKIVLVGRPNVGKSVLFNKLTGRYVTVSNYPGTTVEIARGKLHLGSRSFEVIDTPGLCEISPISEDERVTRRVLVEKHPVLVIHVVEAASLQRSLPFTFQLIEGGFNTLMALNMMDELEQVGFFIDTALLESRLGIPVVPTISTRAFGIETLKKRIENHV